jgi:hypothetical protein
MLVRFALGLTGITEGMLYVVRAAELPLQCFGAVMTVAGAFVVAGLFTSFAGIALALGAACRALSIVPLPPSDLLGPPLPSGIIVTLGIAVALLGPGTFSVDFRLFGRREILIPRSSRLENSRRADSQP